MLNGVPTRFEDGDIIFSQGDPAADLYLIRRGGVSLTIDGDAGPAVVAELAEGDFFGEMAVFDPGPRAATATAVGQVELEAVDRPTFLASMDNDDVQLMLAEMARRISAMLSPERP